jgi:hypothetical protein
MLMTPLVYVYLLLAVQLGILDLTLREYAWQSVPHHPIYMEIQLQKHVFQDVPPTLISTSHKMSLELVYLFVPVSLLSLPKITHKDALQAALQVATLITTLDCAFLCAQL